MRERGSGRNSGQRSLRDRVQSIDKDILRLLLRRQHFLNGMRNSRGKIEATEEKILRESWEFAISRRGINSNLFAKLFQLMQELRIPEIAQETENTEGKTERQAFNLAPPQVTINLDLPILASAREISIWAFLASLSGQDIKLESCLLNDNAKDLLRILRYAGAAIENHDNTIIVKKTKPLKVIDKAINVGDSAWNFYLILAHSLCQHCRVKIAGGTELKLTNFTPLKHFFASVGARLVSIVPNSEGLPMRVEATGILPELIEFSPDLPIEMAEALLFALASYKKNIALDLTKHKDIALFRRRSLAIALQAGMEIQESGDIFKISASELDLPVTLEINSEILLATYFLAFVAFLGGKVRLTGNFANCLEREAAFKLMQICNCQISHTETEITCTANSATALNIEAQLDLLNDWLKNTDADILVNLLPIVAALFVVALIHKKQAVQLPEIEWSQDALQFFANLGLEVKSGQLDFIQYTSEVIANETRKNLQKYAYMAPDAFWGMAIALVACARDKYNGLQLANPTIVNKYYDKFWKLYNHLPEPNKRIEAVASEQERNPNRKRVLTNAFVTLPDPIIEDDN